MSLSTASIGVCQLANGWDAERLMEAADQAMYQAKRSGGDRATVYHAGSVHPLSATQRPAGAESA
jgi:PleD family two-component response regulator